MSLAFINALRSSRDVQPRAVRAKIDCSSNIGTVRPLFLGRRRGGGGVEEGRKPIDPDFWGGGRAAHH